MRVSNKYQGVKKIYPSEDRLPREESSYKRVSWQREW